MNFSDMDMLQDYEKDTRMAVLAYSLMETEIMDSTLRKLIHQAAESAAKSQEKAAHLIMARGDRP
ncbi:hypothetical protein Tfer_1356 [Thermincola ferriacetica]|uniref:Coat F domain protein n=2 Tax=Thermincola TaxID=278993 RepID=D5XC62_THEPJ|nr:MULTISPECIES: hypothetical protein [Thermincola]ADG83514.1 hypothetical protein TherJR_2679 [Thermincola potens JR]KNZ69975.1 hypothetical protein Tfer_1356 [Thermincola ferriacetica]